MFSPALLLAGGVGGSYSKTYAGGVSIAGSATSHSFTSANVLSAGAAATGRLVAVFVSAYSGTPTTPTATINGAAATAVCTVTGGTNLSAAWFILQVDTGTTVDFVVSWGGVNHQNVRAEAYALYALPSSTAHATSTDNAATSGQVTGSMNVQAGGIALAGVVTIDGSSPSWNRSAGPSTEDNDVVVASSNAIAVYSEIFAVAQSPLSLDFTHTAGTGSRSVMAAFSIG